MTIEFKLPDLGEDIETGDVVRVYVSPGDRVAQEQALMELETDKAALEIPSPAAGVIKEVHVKEGDTIKIGQLLVTIDDGTGAEPVKAKVKEAVRGKRGQRSEKRNGTRGKTGRKKGQGHRQGRARREAGC